MPEMDSFCDPSYKLETVNSACSSMKNIFCELVEKGPRAGKFRLRGIPGLKPFCTLPDGPMRAMLRIDGGNRLFVVAGSTVFEVFSDGTFQALIGNVALNQHPVLMTTNGFQLCAAAGGQLYLIEGAAGGAPGTVTQINFTDGTPVRAGTVDFLDNYFIASIVDSKEIRISNLAPDGGIWDIGDVAIKEGYSDNVARVFCDNEQFWPFGFDSAEIWVNTGALFPFERQQGAVLRIGTSAPYSVAGAQGKRFWLWKGVVYSAYGAAPSRVSDFGVEEAIKHYGDTSDAEAFCQIWGGHLFYYLIFPGRAVWVYDDSIKAWHERAFWNADTGIWEQYRPRVYAEAFTKHLVGDYSNGNIYEMDPFTYTDADGARLRRQRVCPYITQNMKNERYNQLTVDMDTGIGLQVAPGQPGYDPQLVLRHGDDRGKNWSYELQASCGKVGENYTRVIYNQLGSARIGKTFELTFDDPCPLVMNTAYLKMGAPEAGR